MLEQKSHPQLHDLICKCSYDYLAYDDFAYDNFAYNVSTTST